MSLDIARSIEPDGYFALQMIEILLSREDFGKTASQKPETDVSRLAGSRRAGDVSPLIVFDPDGDWMHRREPHGGA